MTAGFPPRCPLAGLAEAEGSIPSAAGRSGEAPNQIEKGERKMKANETLALAALVGRTQGQMEIAKAYARAASMCVGSAEEKYAEGYAAATLQSAVDQLHAVRDIQKRVEKLCKEAGYDWK
uniref:Uncharacterized protein n=2 Tax=viral metagenome TaxID=1070528 RepID=A0A6H2A1U8_9ZZZZ